jgi:hypothetical protein
MLQIVNREQTGAMRKLLAASVLATLMAVLMPRYALTQILQGGGVLGGRAGSRVDQMKEKMTGKDMSHQYNAAVLAVGTPRSQVQAAFGQPNGIQDVNGAQEDVYAFFPDGYKYVDPQVTAGTIAAAVFTGGMSLAARQARIIIQQNQLTLYEVRYDANQNIQSVKVIPPHIGSDPAGNSPTQAGSGMSPDASSHPPPGVDW